MSETRSKHVPERTCAVCRKKRPQGEFLRFSRDTNGMWQLEARRANPRRSGRGVYLCADNPACGQEKKLRRSFGAQSEAVAWQVTTYHHTNQELQSGTAPRGVTG